MTTLVDTRRSDAVAQAPAAPRRRTGRIGRTTWWLPWLFVAPALVLFTLFKFVPMAQAFVMSFQEVQPFLGNQWVGVSNYERLFTAGDFGNAAWHTVLLAVGQTTGSLVVGFALALLLEGQARRLWFVRSAAFLPVVVPLAVIAELWRIIYHPTADGLANQIIGFFLLEPSSWINSPDMSLASVMIVGIWRNAPYDMIIIIAGLVGVDRSLYEACALDGGGWFRRITHVTLPAIRPVISIVLTLAAIRGMRVFTEVYLLTNGGPNGSSDVVMTLIYRLGFERNELGVAAAGSVVLLITTIVLTLLVRAAGKQRNP